jgi:hypothetical protein
MMPFRVFIENEAGSNLKNRHDEPSMIVPPAI